MLKLPEAIEASTGLVCVTSACAQCFEAHAAFTQLGALRAIAGAAALFA